MEKRLFYYLPSSAEQQQDCFQKRDLEIYLGPEHHPKKLQGIDKTS